MAAQLSRNFSLIICSLGFSLFTSLASLSPAKAQTSMTGVNIAGAEFGGKALPGQYGRDYFYPSAATISHFAAKGMNVIRLPFRWERVQLQLLNALDPNELARIDAVVNTATQLGMMVVLDVHNYAAYYGKPIGSLEVPIGSLAGLWGQLAARYKGNPRVIFGLMNEPKGLSTETWLLAANLAIVAIRLNGASNLILVPGNAWTGAHSWFSNWYGTPNSIAMLGILDPGGNFAYEVHQYLDQDYSGTHALCRTDMAVITALTNFTAWARQNGKRAFLGEFGGGRDTNCLGMLDRMLLFMKQNSDVWRGWTYWAGGPWSPDYFTSVQPVDGIDRPQMTILKKYIAK